jgi:putative FmdB family regulatory protein
MPIYEYQCEQCGHRLEALQKISDPALTDCPACHQAALKKLVSAASFRLKGGGWYETDFKTGNKKQLADTDSSAAKSDKVNEAGADKKAGSGKAADGKSGEGNKTAKKPAAGEKKADSKSKTSGKS